MSYLDSIGKVRNVQVIKDMAKTCVENRAVLDELIHVIETGTEREVMMASWALSHAVDMNSDLLLEKHHESLLRVIAKNESGTIRRNLIRTWQFSTPEKEANRIEVLETALNLLSDHTQDLAVRVFSITVLENFISFMPEIIDEVLFLLEKESAHASPSFSVRAKRFVKTAEKIKRTNLG